ncbi:MAG TPA: glycosyltransferase [Anaeromyxobacteraceae bacterium]|nr:glycosyltransferase [Anaeromyxobacteraceae bacterium]
MARLPGPLATLVVPVYREGTRLPALVDALAAEALRGPAPPLELLVVDDGSPPGHVAPERASVEDAAARLASAGAPHRFRFLALGANGGKGAAVRRGWSEADPRAAWLGFVDGDGAVPAGEAWRLVRMAAEGAAGVDALAATRMLMAGHTVQRSARRHVQGRVFATLVEELFHLGFYDTQCGLKLFRAGRLRPLLGSLREERWLLDVELLSRLHRAGAVLREVPIDWIDPGGSKMTPGLDALRMGAGLFRLRRRLDAEARAPGGRRR